MKHHVKLRSARKFLSRKQKGAKRRAEQRLKVATIPEKITNQRHDFLHKTSTTLADENQVFMLEKLNVKGMTKNRKLAKQVQDLGLREFSRLVQYKCEWQGKHFVELDQWFLSSQTCFESGWVNLNLTLSGRTWECSSCGVSRDRDQIAAKIIRRKGINLIGALGVSVLESTDFKNLEGTSDYYFDPASDHSSLSEEYEYQGYCFVHLS